MERAANRYLPLGRMAHGFARGKMKGDPVYQAVLQRLQDGQAVLDVGCGEGYLLALVAENFSDVRLAGLDHDARRLDQARAALADLQPDLRLADVRTADLPSADVICCLDVLHYLRPKEQDAVLARLHGALMPGGSLLLRDGRSDGGWRSLVTQFSESVAVTLGRHKGDGVYFRPQAELESALRTAGFEVEAYSCAENTPFANVLYVGKKA